MQIGHSKADIFFYFTIRTRLTFKNEFDFEGGNRFYSLVYLWEMCKYDLWNQKYVKKDNFYLNFSFIFVQKA